MAAQPVPSLVVVGIVDAHLNFELRLSPPSGAVGRREPDSGLKSAASAFRCADQIHPGLVVGVFLEIIIRLELETHFLLACHLVGGVNSGQLPPALTPSCSSW